MDPLKCSCMLAPLANWVRRHRVRGLMCVGRAGSVIAVANLEEECHTPVKKIVPEARESATHVPTKQDTGHKTFGGPKSQVSRLESALSDPHFCERWVCLHKGTRLEPGDQWREDKQICSCLPDGVMECTDVK